MPSPYGSITGNPSTNSNSDIFGPQSGVSGEPFTGAIGGASPPDYTTYSGSITGQPDTGTPDLGGGFGSDTSGVAMQSDALSPSGPESGTGTNPYSSINTGSTTEPTITQSGQYTQPSPNQTEITNISDVGQLAGQSIQSGLNTAASSVGSAGNIVSEALGTSETNLAKTATLLTSSWLDSLGTWFTQGAFILAGLVVIAGAFLFFYMERKGE